MAKRENDLGRDPVGKLLLRLAIPTVTAQLVNALYNIVDRIYIGHIPEVGDLALTGLGVCFPVILFVSAISALVGMGGGSRAVVRMGEGKEDQANAILGNCTALLIALSVLVWRAVRDRKASWYWAAFGGHFAVDFAAVIMPNYSILLTEALFALMTAAIAWYAVRAYREAAAE